MIFIQFSIIQPLKSDTFLVRLLIYPFLVCRSALIYQNNLTSMRNKAILLSQNKPKVTKLNGSQSGFILFYGEFIDVLKDFPFGNFIFFKFPKLFKFHCDQNDVNRIPTCACNPNVLLSLKKTSLGSVNAVRICQLVLIRA